MKNILLVLTVIASFSSLFSCSYSHESGGLVKPVGPNAGLSDPKPNEGEPVDGAEPTVRFADVDATVFKTSCAGCHQKKDLDLNFADYANSKSFASEIYVRVFEDRDMPPKKKLTALEEQVLKTWLDAGSPE